LLFESFEFFGTVAKKARVEIEKQTGKPVIMDTSIENSTLKMKNERNSEK
jgi:hypothetical protein